MRHGRLPFLSPKRPSIGAAIALTMDVLMRLQTLMTIALVPAASRHASASACDRLRESQCNFAQNVVWISGTYARIPQKLANCTNTRGNKRGKTPGFFFFIEQQQQYG